MLPDLDGSGGSLLNGTESFGCSMEHEYVQRVSTLNGINAASSWVWDMTVLTDFLETHPMIDPKRLAVAGCSGGGVQSAYLGSVDERLVAASIACYTSTLAVDYAPSTGLSFIGGGGVSIVAQPCLCTCSYRLRVIAARRRRTAVGAAGRRRDHAG